MAHGALKKLDAESRELIESWDDIVGMTINVLILTTVYDTRRASSSPTADESG